MANNGLFILGGDLGGDLYGNLSGDLSGRRFVVMHPSFYRPYFNSRSFVNQGSMLCSLRC